MPPVKGNASGRFLVFSLYPRRLCTTPLQTSFLIDSINDPHIGHAIATIGEEGALAPDRSDKGTQLIGVGAVTGVTFRARSGGGAHLKPVIELGKNGVQHLHLARFPGNAGRDANQLG